MDFLFAFWAGLSFYQSLVVGFVLAYLCILHIPILKQAIQIHFLKKCCLPESKDTLKELNKSKLWVLFLKNPFLSIFSVVGTTMQIVALVLQFLNSASSLFRNSTKNSDLKVGFVSLFSPFDPLQVLLLSDKNIKFETAEIVNMANRFKVPMVFFWIARTTNGKTSLGSGSTLLSNIICLSQISVRMSERCRTSLDIRCGKSDDELVAVANGIMKLLNNSQDKSFSLRCDEVLISLILLSLLDEDNVLATVETDIKS